MKCFLCPAFCNSEIKQLSPLFLAIFLDIDLIFGMWVYNDQLQIKCMFRSDPMIFGRVMALGLWNLAKYLVVTTFFSLCLEILTWFLVYECIMMTYRSSLHFVLVQWFLAELWPLDFEIWPSCHHFISLWFEILTWFLVCECIVMSCRSSLNFVPIEWFLATLRILDF
jgi:hypothetical protein